MNKVLIIWNHSFRQAIQEWLTRRRWPMLVLCAMVSATAALWFTGEDLMNQRRELQASTDVKRQRLQTLQHSPTGTHDNKSSWEVFKTEFPETAQREQLALSVLEIAQRWGLVVKQASFGPETPTSLGLVGYDVTLPMTGTYIALRSFADEALLVNPGLGMRSIKLQRNDVQVDTLQAQLVFTIWMRQEGAP